MRKIKYVLRIMGFILLITLAVLGVGLAGAVPVFNNRRSKNGDNLTVIEMVEKKKDTDSSSQLKDIIH
jgi:hypothetical protein